MNPSGGSDPGPVRPAIISPTSQAGPSFGAADPVNTGPIGLAGNLDTDLDSTQAVIDAEERQASRQMAARRAAEARGRLVKFGFIVAVLLIGLAIILLRHKTATNQNVTATDASQRYSVTSIPLANISANSPGLSVTNTQTLSINGQLNVNNSIVLAPTTRPDGAVTGQLYYDQTTNQLSYYNGSSFQTLLSGTLPVTVGSLDGATGALKTGSGLNVSGQALSNTGVLTLQGESGNVTLAAGPGIVVNGTTLSNSGVLSLGGQGGNILLGNGLSISNHILNATGRVNNISGAGAISVSDDGNGNFTVSLSASPGSGTVTSSGGLNGKIAMFTGVQNIEDSIISEDSGTNTITVGGDLDVSGTLSLNSPLSVAQGGTGVGTLPTNNVLIGNGTSAISGITGSNGQVLIINGAGAPSFASFSGDVAISGTGATTIQPDAVALGTDTTGNYVANIGATTGLTVGANTGEGSTPTLSVTYGSSASTAVQGNTQLTCPSGTGNVSGGGTVITLGTGGTCGNLNTINNPTFTTSVTTPLLQGAGLNVASTGANSLTFGTNSSTRLTIASSGDLTATGSMTLQGGSLGVGTAAQGGSLVLNDGSSNTGTLQVSPLAQNVVYTLPDPGGTTATICLSTGNCAGSGGGVTASGTVTTNALTKFTGTGNAITSSTLTDDGTVVTTTVGLNVQGGTVTVGTSGQLGSLVLNDGAGGQTTTVQAGNSAGNLTFILPTTAGSSSDCLQKGAGNQLVWGSCSGGGSSGVSSLDAMTGAITVVGTNHEVAVTDNSGTGTITLATPQDIDVTSAPQFGQLTLSSDQTTGDMLTVNNTDTGAPTGNLINLKLNGNSKLSVSSAGNVTGGQYNGQTIASTSNFTGDVTVNGTLTVNTISPSSALTVGVAGQAFTLQGNASSVIKAVGGSGTATVSFQAPTANVTYRFAAASANTYDICTTQGNCVGLGGGVTATSSTTGQIPVFTGSNQVGDSVISQASGNIKIGTALSHANLEVTGTTTLDTPLSVTSGGTGLSALTANEILLANGTGSSVAQLANGSNGDCLVIASGVPVFSTCTGAGGVSSVNTKSGAVTLNGTANQISITNPSGSSFTFATPQNIDTGANVAFGSLSTTNGISTGGTQRIDSSGNLGNIGSITAAGTIQGASLTIGGTVTLNNLTGGASTCLTLDGSHHVGTATCATGSGSAPTLQNVYDNSSTTPLINLSATGKGIFIQDASTTVGGNLFAVQNNGGTTQYLAVTTSGASVAGTVNATSGFLLNGTNININGTLNNVAYLGSTTVNFTGTNLQHGGNAVCDNSNNCNYLTGSAANGSYVQLAPASVQASSSNNSLIFLNDTGTGDLIQLQKSASDEFVVDNSGNVTAAGTIQGASLTINSGGTVTLNNLTGGASTCLTLDGSHHVGTATCATGSGSTPTLQNAYDNSGSTPVINLSATGKGIFIQDASTSVGGNLFAVQNNAGTVKYLAVTTSGASVSGSLSVTTTINATTGIQLNGASINNNGTLSNVAYLGAGTVNFTGSSLQHNGNTVCDNSNNCSYQVLGAYLTGSTGVQLQGSSPGTPQSGNFNINGIGLVATIDATSTTLNLGTANANTLNIGSVGTTIKGTAIHIGDTTNSGSVQTVSLGSIANNSSNTTAIQGGSGSGAVSVQAATSGTISIASTNNNNVAIGTSTTSGTITIGGTSTTGALTVQAQNITQTVTGAASNPSDVIKGTSTGLFQVQNSSSYSILGVDTTNGQAILGTSTHVNGTVVFANNTSSATITMAATSAGSLGITVPGNGGANLPQLDNTANFGKESSQTSPWTAGSYTINGTGTSIGNTDTYLIVTLIDGGSCNNNPTVTFNSIGMTLLGSSTLGEADFTCYYTFGLTGTAGATGTHSIVVTSGTPANSWFSLLATSWYDVNQSTPYGSFHSASGGAGGGSAITYNWPAGRVVVDGVSNQMYWGGTTNSYCQLGPEAPQKLASVGGASSLACTNVDNLGEYSAMGSSYAVSNGGSMTMAWATSSEASVNYISDGSGFDDDLYWAAGAVDLIGDTAGTTTFGNASIGGTNSGSDNQSWLCSPYVSNITGTVSSLAIQIATPASSSGTGADGVHAPNAAVAALYANQDVSNGIPGAPGAPLATSSIIGLASGTNTFTLTTSPQVYAGTVYWMCFMSNTTSTSNNLLKFDTSLTLPYVIDAVNTGWSFNTWPSNMSAPGQPFIFAGEGFEMTATVTQNTPGGTAFTLTNTGQVDLQNASDSTSAFQVQNASGMSLLNVDTTNGQVDIMGSLAGSVARYQQAVGTTSDTDPVIGSAVGYNLSGLQVASGSGSQTVTFQITGLPLIEGTIAYIMSTANKLATGTSGNMTVIVQINSASGLQQMSSVSALASASTSAGITHKDYTVMYSGGSWHIVGWGPTSTNNTLETADYAEYIHYSGDTAPQPGDVLTVGNDYTSAKDSTTPYDSHLIGVVSTDPYQVGGADDGHSVVLALAGRAPVKVSLENGPIEPGDPLTSSSTPGVAMKATQAGQIIGTALEAYDGTQSSNEINVQLHPGYGNPNPGSIQGNSNVSGGLYVGGNANIEGDLTVAGTTSTHDLNVSGNAIIANLSINVALSTAEIAINGHIVTGGETPIVVAGTTSGTGASIAATGTDTSGKLTITLGSGATAGEIIELTFHTAYSAAPNVTVTSGDSNAALIHQYVTPTTTGFSLNAATATGLTPGQTYTFYYHTLQ